MSELQPGALVRFYPPIQMQGDGCVSFAEVGRDDVTRIIVGGDLVDIERRGRLTSVPRSMCVVDAAMAPVVSSPKPLDRKVPVDRKAPLDKSADRPTKRVRKKGK